MVDSIEYFEVVLYVKDQAISRNFYQKLLRRQPELDVPGMTEFLVAKNCKLGLMPNDGIAKILADKMPHPDSGTGIPRCELYLYVSDLENEFYNALDGGALLVSPIEIRNWGDKVGYVADPDGHIIAFAEKASH